MIASLNCEKFVEVMNMLEKWDKSKIEVQLTSFKLQKVHNASKIFRIKKDLTDDALVYAQYVRPILEDGLDRIICFAENWTKDFNECDQFLENLDGIETSVQGIINHFKVNNKIHE